MKYDFSGWATRNDILCTDGRTIRKDAFKECDGKVVPLVWNHQHNDPENVLGHALLKNMDEGVYAYCSFNDSRKAGTARIAVDHGDIDSLSIYANRLKQNGGNVLHGDIKEVSLVLAGANSGAHIEEIIRHGEISEDECVIYANEMIDLRHGELNDGSDDEAVEHKDKLKVDENTTVRDILDSLNEEQRSVVIALISKALAEGEDGESEEAEHADKSESDDDEEEEGKTVQEVLDSLTDEQKNVVYMLIDEALKSHAEAKHSDAGDDGDEDDGEETAEDIFDALTEKQKNAVFTLIDQAIEADNDAKHSDGDDAEDENQNEIAHNEGGYDMNRNLFENNENVEVLSHADQMEIISDAKKGGSLKEAVLAHGITNIGEIYPDTKAISEKPQWIMQDQGWVTKVINGVHHTPFSRVKSVFADLTPDNARAKGYKTKGTEKIEEVISLLKRETSPTTVYKVQKLDRDDIVDITDFDVVAWLKEEMTVKLKEELARAYLIGDGRSSAAADKIQEDKIRPIWTMEDLFAIQATFEVSATATADDTGKAMIKAAVHGFEDYDGSGSTILFIAPDMLSTLLLLEDGFGHRLYKTKAELAGAMLVDEVIPVPPMKNKSRTVTISSVDHTRYLAGIIVDLRDYNVGMTKNGQINWFDDFDINFNKQEYLIETRQSGTLVKPKSAIILEYEVAAPANEG